MVDSTSARHQRTLASTAPTSIRTAAFCRQRSAVRRYASSSSRPMFSRNGSGVEDNPSIRHVEVRALPHESGPSSCARGSPLGALGDEDIPAPQCAAKAVLERRT